MLSGVSICCNIAAYFALSDIDVLLIGRTTEEVYPLRYRLEKLIESGKMPGTVGPHPGYFLKDWKQDYWYSYSLNMSIVKLREDQVGSYVYPQRIVVYKTIHNSNADTKLRQYLEKIKNMPSG